MNIVKLTTLLGAAAVLAGCQQVGPDKTRRPGHRRQAPEQPVAGIWVDPNGCDHWIIDDGVEGYLSERKQPDGSPVCSGAAPPNTAVGPFKEGSNIPDTL